MPIKVLIVDDSILIRQMLEEVLGGDPDIRVVGTAKDANDARTKIKSLNPDVVTLDVEMPGMDGISFLEKIMTLRPMPVVMISTLTQRGAATTIKALELGAVDYVGKPSSPDNAEDLQDLKYRIISKVKLAAKAKVRAINKSDENEVIKIDSEALDPKKIIVIGSSTGGVEALKVVLTKLPKNIPPILVVQHMPAKFTESFAKRMDELCEVSVHEVTSDTKIVTGNVYIAHGANHLVVERSSAGYICKNIEGENVSGHCPSVDVLFKSVAEVVGKNAIGVILTGMGKDGASGMLEMRNKGSFNIGQDENSCVVYGMPKEAFEIKGVERQVSLERVAAEIIKACTVS